MNRIWLIIFLFPLLASCCVNKSADEGTRCILYKDGDAILMSEPDPLISVAMEIVEGCDDVLRLAVLPEMIDSLKAKDTALEIIFEDTIEIDSPFGRKVEANNILIPLSGEFGPSTEMSSAMVLFGVDTYENGPFQNRFARPHLIKLRQLLNLDEAY
ncbi:MAG: hypothetical protein ACP5F3_04690 [Candidatus Syntrophosphaera sp.]